MRYFLLAAMFAVLPLTALAGPREDARAGFAQALGCAPHEVQVATREGLDWMTV